ncbi:MAG: DUF6625 family protein [Pseudomonadota bacterium]
MTAFKLCIVVVWFGRWPAWINLFLRSCVANRRVHFIIFTDCDYLAAMNAPNIQYERLSLQEFAAKILGSVGLTARQDLKAYKLCDFMPLFGFALSEYFKPFTHWGVSDSDLVLGDLEAFLDRDADIFSTHADLISGHFFYVRNRKFFNEAFRLVRGWKGALQTNVFYGLNEGAWSNVFLAKSLKAKAIETLLNFCGINWKVSAKELYTTSHTGIPWVDGTLEYPDHWIVVGGKVFGVKADAVTELPYVHFMSMKPNAKYIPIELGEPMWQHTDLSNAETVWDSPVIRIDARGFHEVKTPAWWSKEGLETAETH